MPSRRAVIVSSCEPCASATSNSRPFAHFFSAPRRCVICRAFCTRERPPWRPIASACSPCSSSSCRVCAYSRAVICTSSPRSSMIAISGRNTSTCALAVMSIQTRNTSALGEQRFHACGTQQRWLLLHVALVPQREREQSPELAAPVQRLLDEHVAGADRKSTRLNSSHVSISYAVFCLKKKKKLNDMRSVEIEHKTYL